MEQSFLDKSQDVNEISRVATTSSADFSGIDEGSHYLPRATQIEPEIGIESDVLEDFALRQTQIDRNAVGNAPKDACACLSPVSQSRWAQTAPKEMPMLPTALQDLTAEAFTEPTELQITGIVSCSDVKFCSPRMDASRSAGEFRTPL